MEFTASAFARYLPSVVAFALIGAGAVVRGDVPAYALMVGVPARRIGWMCQCGVRLMVREGVAHCRSCGASYREADNRLRPVDSPA